MDPLTNQTTIEKRLIANAKKIGLPINGSIELLPLCNMSCEMCYVHLTKKEMEERGRLRTAEEWLEIGRQMKEAGTMLLLLTGGEPLLYPEFKEVYLGMKELGMVLTVNTNGTLLDEEWADFFAENRPRRINITLYGPDEDTYRDLCHYPGGFEKAICAIRLLKERGVDVQIGGSVTPQNVDKLESIIRISREIGCPIAIDQYMMPAERERNLPYPMQARVSPEEAARARIRVIRLSNGEEQLKEYAVKALEQIRFAEESEFHEELCRITCMAGVCSYTINWQGEMRPCVMFSSPSVSVFEAGLRNAWDELHGICSEIRINRKCAECRLRPICRTCPASALLETGDYLGIPDYMCRYSEEFYRSLLEEAGREQ